jgi:2-polyprenyl-3-methyl-5-hydroxy-6-metoxy-1,4-benzoquinol methylase
MVCGHPVRLLYKDLFDDRHGFPGLYSITRCVHCGFCRTDPALRREELAGIYRDYYPRSTETPEGVLRIFEALKKISPLRIWIQGRGVACYQYISPGSKVLDIGCGNCLSLLMAKYYGARQVTGIEVDTNILSIAEKLKLDVHIGQLSDLPVHNGYYDYIMAQQVLEHEPDPKKLLLEMKERLSDHGQIILSFPNVGAFYRFIFRRRWLHWHPPYHINHFSRKSISALAEQCGLKVRKIKTITPNEWMTYQMRTIRIKPHPGQRDTFWDPGAPKIKPETQSRKVLSRKVRDLLSSYGLKPFIVLANRTLDAAGLGESIVVIVTR